MFWEQTEQRSISIRCAAAESPHSGQVGFSESKPASSYLQRRQGFVAGAWRGRQKKKRPTAITITASTASSIRKSLPSDL
jgi:hypothetical protein